jgi:hypothetical protein
MADVVYSVQVEYFSRGRIDPGLDAANRKAKDFSSTLGRAAERIGSSFNSAFDSIASTMISTLAGAATTAGAALAAGVGLAVHEAMRFNEAMEQVQISLAAISVGTGESSNMAQGLRIASGAVSQMRKDAAMLPGSFEDLTKVMTLIMPALGDAGVETSGAEKIAAKLMTAGKIEGIKDLGTVAREYAAMVEGRATGRMPLFTKLGFHDAKSFNALSMGERLRQTNAAINKRTGEFDDPSSAISVFSRSWTAIKETAVDNVRMAVGGVGNPIFEKVKEVVDKFNKFAQGGRGAAIFERMGVAAQHFSEKLGQGFDGALKRGRWFIEEWGPAMMQFVHNIGSGLRLQWFGYIRPLLHGPSEKFKNFLMDPAAISKMEHLVGSLLALRAAGGALQFGGAAMPMLGAVGKFFATAGGSLGVGGGVLATGAVAALALLALSAEGAVHAITNVRSMFHGMAVTLSSNVLTNLKETGKHLEHLWNNIEPVREALGVGLLNSIYLVTGALRIMSAVIEAGTAVPKAIYDTAKEVIKPKAGEFANTLEDDTKAMMDELHAKRNTEYMMTKRFEADTHAHLETDAKPPKHTTHIHQVKIEVKSNQDPRRIAKETLKTIQDFSRRPSSSPFTPPTS